MEQTGCRFARTYKSQKGDLQKCIRRIEIKFGIHSTLFLGFAGIAEGSLKFLGQALQFLIRDELLSGILIYRNAVVHGLHNVHNLNLAVITGAA